jgi:hypothetical protein
VPDSLYAHAVACGDARGALHLQVSARTAAHGLAVSERRPVLAAAGPHAAPLAMCNTALERAVIRMPVPTVAAWAYYGLLAAQMATMLLARLFARQILGLADWLICALLCHSTCCDLSLLLAALSSWIAQAHLSTLHPAGLS